MNLKYFEISTWSEHFALQNVACIQAIGFIFPIHWSEHFALQNVACIQPIGFIFPIHWSEPINKNKKYANRQNPFAH